MCERAIGAGALHLQSSGYGRAEMQHRLSVCARMQNLPLEQVEVLGDFSSSGMEVPVCNGARAHTHVCISKRLWAFTASIQSRMVPVGTWSHKACLLRAGAGVVASDRNSTALDHALVCTAQGGMCRCAGTDVGCLSSPGAVPKYVNATIANLHFHTYSEHVINGERSLKSHCKPPLLTPPKCWRMADRPEPG